MHCSATAPRCVTSPQAWNANSTNFVLQEDPVPTRVSSCVKCVQSAAPSASGTGAAGSGASYHQCTAHIDSIEVESPSSEEDDDDAASGSTDNPSDDSCCYGQTGRVCLDTEPHASEEAQPDALLPAAGETQSNEKEPTRNECGVQGGRNSASASQSGCGVVVDGTPVLPAGGGRAMKITTAHLPWLVKLARLQYFHIQTRHEALTRQQPRLFQGVPSSQSVQ